jgi:3-oxoacyl-(acyl-carrier-protein) synthase
MRTCYINGLSSISHQNSLENEFLDEITPVTNDVALDAIQPSYKEIISPAAGRRMAKGVKMGMFTALKSLEEAGVENPDSIIVGTGLGCMEDSEKFLNAILDNNEQFLTPTSFIQSTHNTVGGQIALALQCKGPNFTYVNGGVSFESGLIDGKMQIDLEESNAVLVGCVDEIAKRTSYLYQLADLVKMEEEQPIDILNTNTKGIIYGEGAQFFVLENEKKDSSYAILEKVSIINTLEPNEVNHYLEQFLKSAGTTEDEIDLVILGIDGDVSFKDLYAGPQELFKNTPQAYYKHLTGGYHTASAFGFWVANQVLKRQTLPEAVQLNKLTKKSYGKVLLYNQYRGKDHSFILLSKC